MYVVEIYNYMIYTGTLLVKNIL